MHLKCLAFSPCSAFNTAKAFSRDGVGLGGMMWYRAKVHPALDAMSGGDESTVSVEEHQRWPEGNRSHHSIYRIKGNELLRYKVCFSLRDFKPKLFQLVCILSHPPSCRLSFRTSCFTQWRFECKVVGLATASLGVAGMAPKPVSSLPDTSLISHQKHRFRWWAGWRQRHWTGCVGWVCLAAAQRAWPVQYTEKQIKPRNDVTIAHYAEIPF